MSIKKTFLIVISITTVIAMMAMIIFLFFSKSILYYEDYKLTFMDVADDSILIEGDFKGASGVGYEGFDYYIENENLYLKIYQQSLFTSEPLNGNINITLDGDFSNLKGIYVVQPKGDPIRIWP